MRRIHTFSSTLLTLTIALSAAACAESDGRTDWSDGGTEDAGDFGDVDTDAESGEGGASGQSTGGDGDTDPPGDDLPPQIDVGGDAQILAESCVDTPEGVDCVYDVRIGAFGGVDGQLVFRSTFEGANYRLWIGRDDQDVYRATVIGDDEADVDVNLIGDREALAEYLGIDPLEIEVQQAQLDLLALMQLANDTIPQPTKTWCERACAVAQVAYCAGVTGAVGLCCAETGGLCCGPGAGLAAGACAIDTRCEERCDSSNL